ncbi:MAG UNVERIFIED_CONTAM: DUF3488 domain-containing protein [Anaerolineae bacterium]|jgi:hypothetical protein
MMIFSYLSLLLLTRSTVDHKEWDWYQQRKVVAIPSILRLQMNLGGAVIAMVALLLAWSIPTSRLDKQLEKLHDVLDDDPLAYLAQTWNQLLSDPDSYGQVTTDYYGADSLTLSGAIQLGDQVVMQVEAPPGRPYYWRSRLFDTYQDGSWSSQANIRLQDSQPPFEVKNEEMVLGSRIRVQQRFTMVSMPSRLVYAAPLPDVIDLPTQADLRYDDDQNMTIYAIRPQKVLDVGSSYLVTSLMSNANAPQLQSAGINYPRWIIDTQLYIPPASQGGRSNLLSRLCRRQTPPRPMIACAPLSSGFGRTSPTTKPSPPSVWARPCGLGAIRLPSGLLQLLCIGNGGHVAWAEAFPRGWRQVLQRVNGTGDSTLFGRRTPTLG